MSSLAIRELVPLDVTSENQFLQPKTVAMTGAISSCLSWWRLISDQPVNPRSIPAITLPADKKLLTSSAKPYFTTNSTFPLEGTAVAMSIPLIDLSNPDIVQLAEQVKDACSVFPNLSVAMLIC